MEERRISYELISKENEDFRREIRFSKIKCNILLFLSSLFAFGYFSYFMKFDMFRNSILMTLFIAPIVINIILWTFWFATNYVQFFRTIRFNYRDFYKERNFDKDSMFEIFQGTTYQLMRQNRTERLMNLLISLQFIIMSLAFIIIYL